jgi:proteic killer suppression protein
VEIVFGTKKLQKAFSSQKAIIKGWGADIGRRIMLRLAQLEAAETLQDVGSHPPARCHPLMGERAGQYAVDLQHPFRLIFVPANDPVPRKPDGSIDLAKVTAVEMLEVVDYHGR